MKKALLLIPVLVLIVAVAGCTQTGQPAGNIKEIVKSEIDAFGGTGIPKVTSIIYQNNEFRVEYTTWDINGGQASVFDEMQQLVGLVVESFEDIEKPTRIIFNALPKTDIIKDTYTTTLTWAEAVGMANLELSYITWQNLTTHTE